MLALSDVDLEGARDSSEGSSAGARHNCDGQSLRPLVHGAAVLEDEAPAAALERASDSLDGDVACRPLGGRERSEHFAFACGDQVTFKAGANGTWNLHQPMAAGHFPEN